MSIITTGDIPSLLRPGLDEVGVDYARYKASGDGRAIFLATRSLFTFVVVTLFVLAYDVMDKTIKYCGS